MASQIIRNIAASLKAAVYYTIMVDETTDAANKEQVMLCIRWMDKFQANEEFIVMHVTGSTTAQALIAFVKDTLLRLNLKLSNCRGQCYDGASAMRNGVTKLIRDEEPLAICTHCYGHGLNLAVGDCVRRCNVMNPAIDVVAENSKLVKKSPKIDAAYVFQIPHMLLFWQSHMLNISPYVQTTLLNMWGTYEMSFCKISPYAGTIASVSR